MTKKVTANGISARNKKKNNHKQTKKVRNENTQIKSEKRPNSRNFISELKRCGVVTDKHVSNITKEKTREEVLARFREIRNKLNEQNKPKDYDNEWANEHGTNDESFNTKDTRRNEKDEDSSTTDSTG